MDFKIFLPDLKNKMWVIVCLMIAFFPMQSFADIFAQSVYGSRQDAVILFTDRCQADNTGELQVAVSQSGSRVRQGCYAVNNRRNAIVKWDDGSIEELDWKIFGKNPLALSVAQKNENGFTSWVFFSGNTTRGTPVCSINISNSNNKNIRNVSVKSLANTDALSVTLYNDNWAFIRGSPVNVLIDFADNQPLKLLAYSDGNILDISLPKEVTATFLSLMADEKQIRFKPEISKENFWLVPLVNIREPLKQFVRCAMAQKHK